MTFVQDLMLLLPSFKSHAENALHRQSMLSLLQQWQNKFSYFYYDQAGDDRVRAGPLALCLDYLLRQDSLSGFEDLGQQVSERTVEIRKRKYEDALEAYDMQSPLIY